jgi:hypothetical protein
MMLRAGNLEAADCESADSGALCWALGPSPDLEPAGPAELELAVEPKNIAHFQNVDLKGAGRTTTTVEHSPAEKAIVAPVSFGHASAGAAGILSGMGPYSDQRSMKRLRSQNPPGIGL